MSATERETIEKNWMDIGDFRQEATARLEHIEEVWGKSVDMVQQASWQNLGKGVEGILLGRGVLRSMPEADLILETGTAIRLEAFKYAKQPRYIGAFAELLNATGEEAKDAIMWNITDQLERDMGVPEAKKKAPGFSAPVMAAVLAIGTVVEKVDEVRTTVKNYVAVNELLKKASGIEEKIMASARIAGVDLKSIKKR